MTSSTYLAKIKNWLTELNIESFICEHCEALHLSHLQLKDNVLDAKIEIIDDVLTISIISEIKPHAIIMLMSELCQINKHTFFIKTFIDVNDSDIPQIKFVHSLYASEDLTFNQFSIVLSRVEEEALELIEELSSCEMINHKSHKLVQNSAHFLPTFH